MRNLNFKAVFILLFVCSFVYPLTAQNKRNKPKPLATPPVVTGAEIISQSGDYVEPAPTPTAENPQPRAATTNAARIKELNDRVKKLEAGQSSSYDERQKRVLMNLDILTRAEQRADSLRKQLFDMIERENSIRARLDQIDYDIRPEIIERSLQISGSMRPEEVRENRRKSLSAERTNLQSLLAQIQATHTSLDLSLQKAEQMVEKLRAKAEKDIDDSLQTDEEQQKTVEPPADK